MSAKCDLCEAPAVVRAERVKGGGKNGVGTWERKAYCEQHGRDLIRETAGRYRLVHLVSTPRVQKVVVDQQAWDMP